MEIRDKLNEVLEKTTLDEKIKENPTVLKETVDKILEKTDIDDKIKEKFSKK